MKLERSVAYFCGGAIAILLIIGLHIHWGATLFAILVGSIFMAVL